MRLIVMINEFRWYHENINFRPNKSVLIGAFFSFNKADEE